MRRCILILMWRIRPMKHTRMILVMLLWLLCVEVLALAHGDYTRRVIAIGASSEYAYMRDSGKVRHDAGALISCRMGFYSFFSLFFCADAGYRITSRRVLYRAGGEGYLGPGIIVLHADLFSTVAMKPGGRSDVPGVSAGLVSSLPFNPSITLFAGGSFSTARNPNCSCVLLSRLMC